MPVKNPLGDKSNRFSKSEVTHEDVNPHLVNGLEEREGKPLVAPNRPLNKIIPDRQQPRRLIPMNIRREWDGTPSGVTAMLMQWHRLVEQRMGQRPPVVELLRGEEVDIELPDAITTDFFKVVDLAAGIHASRLINPITVYKSGELYIVETGERRLMAFHLLYTFLQDQKYAAIPAQLVDEFNPWDQAKENTARSDLNAISKSRQLALLYMAMYPEREFASYDEMLTPEGSDRPFYAQAIDLNSRRGQGGKLMSAMNVSNRSTVTYYKKLWDLPDEDWVRGDEQNMSLNELLRIVDEEAGTSYGRDNKKTQHNDVMFSAPNINDSDTPTTDPLAPPDSPSPRFSNPPSQGTRPPLDTDPTVDPVDGTLTQTKFGWTIGDKVFVKDYGEGTITAVTSSHTVNVEFDDWHTIENIQESHLELPPTMPPPVGDDQRVIPSSTPRQPAPADDYPPAVYDLIKEREGYTRAELNRLRDQRPTYYTKMMDYAHEEIKREAFLLERYSADPYPIDTNTQVVHAMLRFMYDNGPILMKHKDSARELFSMLVYQSPLYMRRYIDPLDPSTAPEVIDADMAELEEIVDETLARFMQDFQQHINDTRARFMEVIEKWKNE